MRFEEQWALIAEYRKACEDADDHGIILKGDQVRSMLRALNHRFDAIKTVIDQVEDRCMAVDGPVTPTHKEITDDELRTIYVLAGGQIQ